MAKEYKIFKYLLTTDLGTRVIDYTGTLEELKHIECFSYTLERGRAYQHEKGNHKIPTDDKIKSVKSLVKALNNSEINCSFNGIIRTRYKWKEGKEERNNEK